MPPTGHRNAAADTTGWLLGTIIVVLAVLDLLIWATLWNVPNPISKMLVPQTVMNRAPAGDAAPFAAKPGDVMPAALTGAAAATKPARSRVQ